MTAAGRESAVAEALCRALHPALWWNGHEHDGIERVCADCHRVTPRFLAALDQPAPGADERAEVTKRSSIFLAHYYDVPHRACTGCELRDVSQVEHAEHVLNLLDESVSDGLSKVERLVRAEPGRSAGGFYLRKRRVLQLIADARAHQPTPPDRLIRRGVCSCGEVDKENRLGHQDGCRYFSDSVYQPTPPAQAEAMAALDEVERRFGERFQQHGHETEDEACDLGEAWLIVREVRAALAPADTGEGE